MSPARLIVALAVVLVACGGGEPEPTPAPTPEPPPRVVLAVAPTAERVVRGWLSEGGASDVELLVVDEALGLGMLAGGEVTGAVVHRRATPAEARDATAKGLVDAGRLEHVLLARDSIALAVHPINPLGSLTRDQARALLVGEIAWDDLDGPPPTTGQPVLQLPKGPAQVYLRGPGHSSLRGLGLLRAKEPAGAVRLGTDDAVAERLSEDPAGLALVPVSALTGGRGEARGKALGLREADGAVVQPGSGTRGGPIWPLLRPLYLVRPADPGTAAQVLVDVAHSVAGEEITRSRGLLPASPVRPRKAP